MSLEYFENENALKFIAWTIVSFIGYIIAILSLNKIKCCCNKISKYLNVSQENYFEINHIKKTSFEWYKNISYTIMLSIMMFFISNLQTRIKLSAIYILYPCVTYLSSITFGLLVSSKVMEIVPDKYNYMDINKCGLLMYIMFPLILLTSYGYEIYLSYLDKTIFYYLSFQLVIVIFYIIMWKAYTKHSMNTKLHCHHWIITLGACFLFRSDSLISNIIFCIMHGCFLEGSVCYGLADIFRQKAKEKDPLIGTKNLNMNNTQKNSEITIDTV